ncbi:flagellar hook-basal body complex protein FliE [Natronospora cellulosivora (SeqCode)]
MINSINGYNQLSSFNNDNNKTENKSSFIDVLKDSINGTNDLLKNADKLAEAFALGELEDIHKLTIATEKANLALNMTLTVQNKVLEAYNEIMRMQI